MNRYILFSIFLVFLFFNCAEDNSSNYQIGKWDLVSYSVGISIDLNNDTIFNENLLDEINCKNQETLVFEDDIVSDNKTFNPDIKISLINAENKQYDFKVECDTQGVIGFATDYTKSADTITFQNRISIIKGNTLTRVLKDNIVIYNAEGTEVVDKKDLTLVYKKQE